MFLEQVLMKCNGSKRHGYGFVMREILCRHAIAKRKPTHYLLVYGL